MGKKKKSYVIKTKFCEIIEAVKELCVGTPSDKDKLFVDCLIEFFSRRVANISEINPRLSLNEKLTETQTNYLKVIFLKTVLDTEDLESLCLYPPKGTPFKAFACFLGPCFSREFYRGQDYECLNRLRKSLNLASDYPDNYYDGYKEQWDNKIRASALSRKKQFPDASLSPLILFPVAEFSIKFKEEVITSIPQVVDFIDSLFICCDHFVNLDYSNKTAPLRSSTIFNYSLEYLIKAYDNGTIGLNIKKGKTLQLPYIEDLKYFAPSIPTVTVPELRDISRIKSSPGLVNAIFEMNNYSWLASEQDPLGLNR
jgi:hypothetical protein